MGILFKNDYIIKKSNSQYNSVKNLSNTHIFGQFGSAEHVEVNVLDRLTAVLAHVGDNTVAVRETARGSHLGDRLKDRGDLTRGRRVDSVSRLDVSLGHDENVDGSLRIYVAEGKDLFVLIDLGGGDIPRNNFTENTRKISHFYTPLQKNLYKPVFICYNYIRYKEKEREKCIYTFFMHNLCTIYILPLTAKKVNKQKEF